MPVTVACPNGHRFFTREQFIGKLVICPSCSVQFRMAALGQAVEAPKPAVSASGVPQTIVFEDGSSPAPSPGSAAPATPRPAPVPSAPAPITQPQPTPPSVVPAGGFTLAETPATQSGDDLGYQLAAMAATPAAPARQGATQPVAPVRPGRLGVTPSDRPARRHWRSSDFAVGTILNQGMQSFKRNYPMLLLSIITGVSIAAAVMVGMIILFVSVAPSIAQSQSLVMAIVLVIAVTLVLASLYDIMLAGPLWVATRIFRHERVQAADLFVGVTRLGSMLVIGGYRLVRLLLCYVPLFALALLIGAYAQFIGRPPNGAVWVLLLVDIITKLFVLRLLLRFAFASVACIDLNRDGVDACHISSSLVDQVIGRFLLTIIVVLLIAYLLPIVAMLMALSSGALPVMAGMSGLLSIFAAYPFLFACMGAAYGILSDQRKRR